MQKQFFDQMLEESRNMYSEHHRTIIHRNPLLHIDNNGDFDLMLYYQVPVVGTAKFSASNITLIPRTLNGRDKKDWQGTAKTEAERKEIERLFSPVTGSFDSNSGILRIDFQPWQQVSDYNDDPGVSVLRPFAPKSHVERKTVSQKEADLVGTWRSYSGTPAIPNATPAEKAKQNLEDIKQGGALLCLRSDNTYDFDDASRTHGRWTLEGGKLTLFPDATDAEFPGDKDTFEVSTDLKVLTTKGFFRDTLPLRRVTE